MAALLEPMEREAAKERQGQRTDKHPDKLAESSKGESRAKVAAAVGMSPVTLHRAKAVVQAAKDAGISQMTCRADASMIGAHTGGPMALPIRYSLGFVYCLVRSAELQAETIRDRVRIPRDEACRAFCQGPGLCEDYSYMHCE